MARNGWVNRLLDMIGLVDDGEEPQQEKNDRSRQSSSGSGSARSSAFGSGSRYSSRNEESEGSGARRRDNDGSGYSSYRSNFERSASAGRTYSTRTEEPQDDRDDLEKAFDNMGSSSRQRTSGPRRSAQASSAAGTQTRTAQHGSTGTKIHHVNMHALEECRAIIRDLAEGSVVIVNLESIDDRLLQRALDTLGGAACALHQWMEPVGDRMYMIGSKAVQFDHNYDYSRTMDDRYDR